MLSVIRKLLALIILGLFLGMGIHEVAWGTVILISVPLSFIVVFMFGDIERSLVGAETTRGKIGIFLTVVVVVAVAWNCIYGIGTLFS